MKKPFRRRWIWLPLFLLGIPVLLVVILLQPPVLKALILPKLEQALEMDIEVESLRLSPLKQLDLVGVQAKKTDGSLDVTLESARVRYEARSLFGNRPTIHSITLVKGDVTVQPDQIGAASEASPSSESPSGLPPKVMGLVMGPLELQDWAIRIEESGRRVELSTLNLTLPTFRFEGVHTLNLATQASLSESTPLETGELQARLSGSLQFEWAKALEGQLELVPEQAAGNYDLLTNLGQARLTLKLDEDTVENVELVMQDVNGQALGRIEARGPLNPFSATEDVRLQVDQIGHETFLLLGGILGVEFGPANLAGTLTGTWERGRFSVKGAFQTENFGVRQKETVLLKPNDYGIELDADFDQSSMDLGLQKLVIGWKPEDAFTNQLSINGDLNLKDPTQGSGALVLKAGRLNLDAILPDNLLTPPSTAEATTDAGSTPAALPVGNLALALNVEQLTYQQFNIRNLQAKAEVLEQRLKLTPLALGFNDASLLLEGELPLDGSLNRLTANVQAENLNLPEWLALSPVPLPVELKGHATLKGRVTANEDGTELSWNSDLHTTAFSLSQDGTPVLLPSDYHLSMTTTYRLPDASLSMEKMKLGWTPEEDFTNTLFAEGSLSLANLQAITGQLSLSGGRINVDAILPPPPEQVEKREPPSPTSSEPPSRLPFGDPFTLYTRIKHLRVRGIELDGMSMLANRTETRLKLELMKGRLNHSDITFMLEVPPSLELTGTRVSMTAEQLDLGKLVDAFAPALKDRFDGILDMAGALVITDPFRESTGQIRANITEGQLFLLEDAPEDPKAVKLGQALTRLILESTATALDVAPDRFTAPPIEELTLHLDLKNSALEIQEAHMANEEILLRSTGRIPLQEQPSITPLQNLQIQMGVSTNIATKARIYRENRVEDGWVMLPPFLQIQGTLEKPELDVKKRVITGLILSGVTDHIKVGDDDTHRIIQGVGALLTGERLPPTPTPTPGEEPEEERDPSTTEQILQGLDLFLRSRE